MNNSFQRLALATALAVLVACARPANVPPAAAKAPTVSATAVDQDHGHALEIKILSLGGAFTRGGAATLQISVTSRVAGSVQVYLTAPDQVGLAQRALTLSVGAGETRSAPVPIAFGRAGYHIITASAHLVDARGEGIIDTAAAVIGLDVAPPGAAPGGSVALNAYLDSLPVRRDRSYLAGLLRADLEGRDDVPFEVRTEGLRGPRLGGGEHAAEDAVIALLPGTGSGSPAPGELGSTAPPARPTGALGRVKAVANCGTLEASLQITLGMDNAPTRPLTRTKVTVYDYNDLYFNGTAWVGGPVAVHSGFTDDTGTLTYQQPVCDTSSWSDNTGPDIYYVLETTNPEGLYVQDYWGARYAVQTGTNWNDTPQARSLYMGASTGAAHNAFGAFQLARLGIEFNAVAGGAGADRFPLRIIWPQGIGGVSFAPVGMISLYEADWGRPEALWHELGHSVMWYTTTPEAHRACSAPNAGICDPGYESPFNYGHSWEGNYSPAKGFNEGWANYFFQVIAEEYKSSLALVNGRPVFAHLARDCVVRWDTAACRYNNTDVATGLGNEARVSTWLWRYTQTVLANGYTSASTLRAAYGTIRGTMWNNLKRDYNLFGAWAANLNQSRNYGPADPKRWELTRINAESTIGLSWFAQSDHTIPSLTFDLQEYRDRNPDIAGWAEWDLANHYTNTGLAEGRRASVVFDPAYYRARNPSLASYSNADLAWHYRNSGVYSGLRASAEFDLAAYRFYNTDVPPDNYGATIHYLRYGRAQGRRAAYSRVTAGLVAEYRFDAGSGATTQTITDYSGNGRHATRGSTTGGDANDPAWTSQGLDFNGSNHYAKLPDSALFGPNLDFTVMAVARSDVDDATNRNVWAWGGNSQYGRPHLQRADSRRLECGGLWADIATSLYPGTSTFMGTFRYEAAANRIHCAPNRLSSQHVITMGGNEVWPAQKGKIGSNTDANYGEFWDGHVYWMAIYNRRLTDTEVRWNYDYAKNELLAGRGVTLP